MRKSPEIRKKYQNWAVAEVRRKLKLKAIEYKGGACKHCGYAKCPAALQFHHAEPSKKDFRIGKGHSMSWVKCRDELDKTILLCSNCHAEHHFAESLARAKLQELEVRKLVPSREEYRTIIRHGSISAYNSGCRCTKCDVAQVIRRKTRRYSRLYRNILSS